MLLRSLLGIPLSGEERKKQSQERFIKMTKPLYKLGTGMGRAFLKDPQKAFEFKRRLDTIFK
jgi:hypothetical protein